jgi:hypothetical protein
MAQIIVVDFNMRHFFALLALEVKLEILFSARADLKYCTDLVIT